MEEDAGPQRRWRGWGTEGQRDREEQIERQRNRKGEGEVGHEASAQIKAEVQGEGGYSPCSQRLSRFLSQALLRLITVLLLGFYGTDTSIFLETAPLLTSPELSEFLTFANESVHKSDRQLQHMA